MLRRHLSPFRRYRKIHLLDGNGAEFTLLLDRNARFHIGTPYRFYFQKNARPLVGNPYLDASLSTNTFLGYEEIQVSDINESKSEEIYLVLQKILCFPLFLS